MSKRKRIKKLTGTKRLHKFNSLFYSLTYFSVFLLNFFTSTGINETVNYFFPQNYEQIEIFKLFMGITPLDIVIAFSVGVVLLFLFIRGYFFQNSEEKEGIASGTKRKKIRNRIDAFKLTTIGSLIFIFLRNLFNILYSLDPENLIIFLFALNIFTYKILFLSSLFFFFVSSFWLDKREKHFS